MANRESTVYVVQAGRYIKIGISASLHERLRCMQADLPFEVSLIAACRCKDAAATEHLLHVKLIKHHVRGEWFKASATRHALDYLMQLCRDERGHHKMI